MPERFTFEEREKRVSGSVAAAFGAGGCGAGDGSFFDAEVGVEVDLVSTLSCPSQRAMTVVSTPAARSCMAQVCRRACGVMCLAASVGLCWG